MYFVDEAPEKPKKVVIQVKSGTVSVRDVRDLVGTAEREKAAMAAPSHTGASYDGYGKRGCVCRVLSFTWLEQGLPANPVAAGRRYSLWTSEAGGPASKCHFSDGSESQGKRGAR
jgi:hypothetical protein